MAKTYEEIFGIEDDMDLPEQSGSIAKSYEEIFGIEDEDDDSLERTSSVSSGREDFPVGPPDTLALCQKAQNWPPEGGRFAISQTLAFSFSSFTSP